MYRPIVLRVQHKLKLKYKDIYVERDNVNIKAKYFTRNIIAKSNFRCLLLP